MQLRRCAIVLVEPRETAAFDLASLVAGGDGLARRRDWLARAPHLDDAVVLDAALVPILGELSPEQWQPLDALVARHGARAIEALVALGLVVPDDDAARHARADRALRDTWWEPTSAVAYHASRWAAREGGRAAERAGLHTLSDIAAKLGPPPPAVAPRGTRATALPRSDDARRRDDALLALLERRVTCRNFDPASSLPLELVAHVLQTVFGALAVHRVDPEIEVLKKTSPAGGGLHSTDAYLIAARVDGVATGIHHYDPVAHVLREVRAIPVDEVLPTATRFLASQAYFAAAPALVVLVNRFRRKQWKYRHHPKSLRTAALDAGHLSQTLYLVATSLGLGAFVTAAINERDIEAALALEPMVEGPIAMLGFGARAAERKETEFDPLGAAWPAP